MILHALADYYARRNADADPAQHLPAFGLERKAITHILELHPDGRLAQVLPVWTLDGKRRAGTPLLLPAAVKKTSGVAANLLWENAEYALGLADAKKGAERDAEKYQSRLAEMHAAFRSRLDGLPPAARNDAGVRAVMAFLDRADIGAQLAAVGAPVDELGAPGSLVTFRLLGDLDVISQRPAVAPHVAGIQGAGEAESADAAALATVPCLVSGEMVAPARVHPSIKGVWGAQSSGANLVSFNCDAFRSFGREQGANAPVGEAATFAYTTALNALLARESRQRMQVGDASTVFWSQRREPTELEVQLASLLGSNLADDADAHADQVRALFESIRSGVYRAAGDNRFFVLGLAPNAARLSVRFWHTAPLSDVAERIAAWFDDLALEGGPNDRPHPPLWLLLAATTASGKAGDAPARLGGDVMRAILQGSVFPPSWWHAALIRCRAEQDVGYARAAILKASLRRIDAALRRDGRGAEVPYQEIGPMLDPDNRSVGYRLGRLFFVLEWLQAESADRDVNKSILRAFYGRASTQPAHAFGQLMALSKHHLAKLDERSRGAFEKRIAEIIGGIRADDAFPARLDVIEQGRFAIGYYHQRQHRFRKRPDDADAAEAEPGSAT